MGDTVEEEELRDDEGFDQHDDTRSNHRQKADDVADADHVQDNVAWTSQGAFKKRHVGFGCSDSALGSD